MSDSTTPPVALRAQRERTIDALCRHFALDHLEVGEFEKRLDDANRALTLADLERLTADLPAESAPTTAVAAPRLQEQARVAAPAPAPGGLVRRAQQVIVGLLGGATRRGRWTPARESTAVAVMGGVMLDFREAQLAPGETVVHAVAFWGGVSIVVPPGLNVTVDGIGILGGFDHTAQDAGASAAPDAPRLRVDGVAIMGGVDVRVKAPGEPLPWDDYKVGVHHGRHELRQHARELRDEARQQARELRHEVHEEARRLRDEYRGGR